MGLSILMTLAGCPICAESLEVMLVDQLFVDIGDQQSIEKSLSSFSAHMETMTKVNAQATSKSIVLLDELGSQTDPLEGESLSMAILDHFRDVGCWVIATTHFSRLKNTVLNMKIFSLQVLNLIYVTSSLPIVIVKMSWVNPMRLRLLNV